MCGIAGILGPQSRQQGLDLIERVISALNHRGPDGRQSVHVPVSEGRNLFLGHARLSILDLTDNSAQPMLDEETGSYLVYNGEIYNYAALRRELEARGHRFSSTGDTEVLLKALVEWGPAALERLRGMYAFAFWDGKEERLVLARDPLGIKPLLLAHAGGCTMFASELRSFAAADLFDFTLGPTAVRSYLAFGAVIEPATMVEEIVSIPPGHVVIASADGRIAPPRRILALEKMIEGHVTADSCSFDVAVERATELLEKSVREHLVSDVPVGVFLSGGIDSSIIATLAERAEVTQDLSYLTVCFPDQEFSELGYAQQVARDLRGKHQAVHLDAKQMLSLLPQALAAMDQPTVDGINTYVLSSVAAQQGIKVVVSGLGGDEVFGGYSTFWKAPLLGRFPVLLSRAARVLPGAMFGSESERRKLVQAAQCFDTRDAYLLQRSLRWSPETSRIAMLGTLPDNSLVTPEVWELMSTDHELSDHNRISYLESVFYMRNQLLRDSDIFSSANSIELRVPFLDLDLIQAAWSMPAAFHRSLMGGGKRVLKRILDALHPGLPLGRRKMGFMFPWQRWLREPHVFERVADTLHTSSTYQGLGVEPNEGRVILGAFQQGDGLISWSHVWSLFVLLDWNGRMRNGFAAA